mmetsp:Transcript_31583/g.97571  ORF Transcript_31583/g.97571 Transcript_31583/m.97571 type:complete len:225 (-) Transcript_31583:16-690(-)
MLTFRTSGGPRVQGRKRTRCSQNSRGASTRYRCIVVVLRPQNEATSPHLTANDVPKRALAQKHDRRVLLEACPKQHAERRDLDRRCFVTPRTAHRESRQSRSLRAAQREVLHQQRGTTPEPLQWLRFLRFVQPKRKRQGPQGIAWRCMAPTFSAAPFATRTCVHGGAMRRDSLGCPCRNEKQKQFGQLGTHLSGEGWMRRNHDHSGAHKPRSGNQSTGPRALHQ